MRLLDEKNAVHRMDERIANAETILFLMAEVICRNYERAPEREDRLARAICELAGCQRSHRRVRAMVERELAKC
jgi:hypothetical protein